MGISGRYDLTLFFYENEPKRPVRFRFIFPHVIRFGYLLGANNSVNYIVNRIRLFLIILNKNTLKKNYT